MCRKQVQRKRIMTLFVDAADEIVREEGIDRITIRKVAEKAGYNSATLYNYFENVDHLILFTAMRYIGDYSRALPKYLEPSKHALDKFIRVWECFCHFAFRDPEIYRAIFFADLDKDLEDYIIEYYKLFPEELGPELEGISTMLLKHNIYERGLATIGDCVKEGFIREEDAQALNEMGTILFEGVLQQLIKGKVEYDGAVEKTMRYIHIVVDSLSIK